MKKLKNNETIQMTSELNTLYLDCTATVFSGLNTGIQRVVRNVVRRQCEMEIKYSVRIVPVVGVLSNFYEVSAQVVLNAKPITASLGIKIRTLFDKIKQFTLKKIMWPKILIPLVEKIIYFIEWSLKKVFWLIKFIRIIKTVQNEGRKKVSFQPEDKLILLDAFWQFDLSNCIRENKPKKIITVMFDLVPINHPECVEEVNRNLFVKALPWVLEVTNKFLCISNDVRDQLIVFCKNNNVVGKEFDYFLLGSDFEPLVQEMPQSEDWISFFEKSCVWLMVGTIEPRKNHVFALDAFDLMWKEGKEDRLLIIGRVGWKCDQLISRIKNHNEYGIKLFLMTDVSDYELFYAYKKSSGLIFSSFAEGFGLPLVEAMATNIKVVCSDIPIFREVGCDYPIYFRLESPQNLCEAIELSRTREVPKAVKWLSWEESVNNFIKIIVND